uniref:UBR-type domain-containing protein n=1 Tax=Timema tahoe TaxID=61484 RepID=A0A7R9IBL4_9NEOP|nr:unnamed protein product [Timema tahoe]
MAESSSSTNSANIEDQETNVVTMIDVLKEEEDMEENAKALLGGFDDKTCSYSKEYVRRQPLYSCLTCKPKENLTATDVSKLAGVCLACSYHCHEGHDLVELYTKRNFRCDCGNSKFRISNTEHKKLDSMELAQDMGWWLTFNKDAMNELNLYNHNFLGLYCVCERPYPDPEVDVEDEMTQCIVCEDWYHGNHLGSKSPPHDDFSEMICFRCMERNDFLWHYRGLFVTPLSTESDITPSTAEVNITPSNGELCQSIGSTRKSSEINVNGIAGIKQGKACIIKDRELLKGTGSVFCSKGWRKLLCTCNSCQDIYKTNNVSFLLDEEDSMSAYEERNKDGQFSTSYERGMRALSSLDRVQQVEAIEGFNDMKSHLKEYLQKFAENKKVVREEDIREFFLGLEARKKQKLEVNIPHFCR